MSGRRNNFSYEECQEKATLCTKRHEFHDKFRSYWECAQKHQWLNRICKHMNPAPHSRGYWNNKERVRAEALLYHTRTDFFNGSPCAHRSAIRNGWIDELCKHMDRGIKTQKYWNNKKHCIEEAQKYKTRTEFARKSHGCYSACSKHGWLNEVCTHMGKSHYRQYNFDKCKEIALHCTSKAQMKRENPTAYNFAYKQGWIPQIFKHIPPRQPIMTEEKCMLISQKYTTRIEFKNEQPKAYNYANRHGILSKVCQHMIFMGEYNERCIYVAEFPDNCVYVGLTCCFERRMHEHLTDEDSSIYQHIRKTGYTPDIKIVHNYIDIQRAKKLEGTTLREYIEKGWEPLNRTGTGGIGAGGTMGKNYVRCRRNIRYCTTFGEFSIRFPKEYQLCVTNNWLDLMEKYMGEKSRGEYIQTSPYEKRKSHIIYEANFVERLRGKKIIFVYTDEELAIEAKKHLSKTEFRSRNSSAYRQAKERGLLESICAHMQSRRRSNEYLALEAQKYTTRQSFREKSNAAYQLAMKRGILDTICHFMPNHGYMVRHIEFPLKKTTFTEGQAHKRYRTQRKYWTLEHLIKEAQKYNSRTSFQKGSSGAYSAAAKEGLLDIVCAHLPSKIRHRSKEEIAEIAKKYDCRSSFKKNSPNEYEIAYRHGWLNDICKHMPSLYKKWRSIDSIKKESIKYKKKSDFMRYARGAYNAASQMGILDIVCKHMNSRRKPYTQDELLAIAHKYETKAEFIAKNRAAYVAASRKGILHQICAHMLMSPHMMQEKGINFPKENI